jgi:hypothetical protein
MKNRLIDHPVYAVECRKGCYWCCHNVVMVSAPEIFLIADNVRKTGDAAFIAATFAGAERIAALGDETRYAKKIPCALLRERVCSVYKLRPTVCRKHTSFSLISCKDEYEGNPRTESIPTRQVDQMLFEACSIAWSIAMALWDGRKDTPLELSSAVRTALAEEQAERRWLEGEEVFKDVLQQSSKPGIDESVKLVCHDYCVS